MHNCISFTPTIQQSLSSKNNIAKWNETLDSYDNKDYRKAIYDLFDYIDEDILKHYANADQSQIIIPQGSAVVIIDIGADTISIKTSFVKLPADKQLPILRKCTELNFGSMSLPQIFLDGDMLTLSYSMPIELCEPYKLYDTLRDMATNADKYDDEFVSKFGATRIMEPQIKHYPDEQLQEIHTNVIAIADEALKYAAYYESKRDLLTAGDSLFIGINRIKYYADPTGVLNNKLNDAISSFYNRNNDINAKIKIMRGALEAVKNIGASESKNAFCITYQLIPLKSNASRGYLKDWIAKQYENVESLVNKENYSIATIYSLYTLYVILADFNIDENSSRAIEYSLKKAAGKPWAETAPILLKAMRFFYLNEQEAFDMEEEIVAEGMPAFNTEEYMKDINGIVDQYKSMIGNFMKGLAKN
ncbi:MAG: hypothetical protein QM768_09655 [Agriterribacter sp.]